MGLALIRKKKEKKKIKPIILCLLGVCCYSSTSTSTINKALGEISFFDDRKNSDVLLNDFFFLAETVISRAIVWMQWKANVRV